MGVLQVAEFGGEMPRLGGRHLPATAAALAVNADLGRKPTRAFPALALEHSFASSHAAAYRFAPPGETPIWVGFSDPLVRVAPSPLTNDSYKRLYWTVPGDGLFWNTYARLVAGDPAYNAGFNVPAAKPSVSTAGGTATEVTRAYVYTFVDGFGQESSPSEPSDLVTAPSDATWTVASLPSSVTAPGGKSYPAVTLLRIYRTTVGTTTGATYRLVDEITLGPTSYADTENEAAVARRQALPSTNWAPPPDDLDGLVVMPGGFFAGFSGRTVHFSEPNRPWAWPAGYDLSVNHTVVGLGVWQQTLVAATAGEPVSFAGASPASMTPAAINLPEPCLSAGSIVADASGVYYAGPSGLIQAVHGEGRVVTGEVMDAASWEGTYSAATIVAAKAGDDYFALTGAGEGFLIGGNSNAGLVRLRGLGTATYVWTDSATGTAYLLDGEDVYRWADAAEDPATWVWRSKEWMLPDPTNFAAARVDLDAWGATDALPDDGTPEAGPIATDSRTPQEVSDDLSLPSGALALLRLFANRQEVASVYLRDPISIFRLPSGFKADIWQFELVAQVPVYSVRIASTMKELQEDPAP